MSGKATAVEATFTRDGEVNPRRFQWHGTWLVVEGLGRRWEEDGQRCFNVVATGDHLFELRLDLETLCWSVTVGPIPRLAV